MSTLLEDIKNKFQSSLNINPLHVKVKAATKRPITPQVTSLAKYLYDTTKRNPIIPTLLRIVEEGKGRSIQVFQDDIKKILEDQNLPVGIRIYLQVFTSLQFAVGMSEINEEYFKVMEDLTQRSPSLDPAEVDKRTKDATEEYMHQIIEWYKFISWCQTDLIILH